MKFRYKITMMSTPTGAYTAYIYESNGVLLDQCIKQFLSKGVKPECFKIEVETIESNKDDATLSKSVVE